MKNLIDSAVFIGACHSDWDADLLYINYYLSYRFQDLGISDGILGSWSGPEFSVRFNIRELGSLDS